MIPGCLTSPSLGTDKDGDAPQRTRLCIRSSAEASSIRCLHIQRDRMVESITEQRCISYCYNGDGRHVIKRQHRTRGIGTSTETRLCVSTETRLRSKPLDYVSLVSKIPYEESRINGSFAGPRLISRNMSQLRA